MTIPRGALPTVPDLPRSPAPPGEGRTTGQRAVWRSERGLAPIDGATGIGTPQPAQSFLEDRPARIYRHDYTHDQQAYYYDENDGGRTAVGLHPGWPRGDHEAGTGEPQRPTFRTPPETWGATVPQLEA